MRRFISSSGLAGASTVRVLISIVAALVAGSAAAASAATLCVSADGKVPPGLAKKMGCSPTVYTTIGAAFIPAAPGDTVFVLHGTYKEDVTIPGDDTGITLQGQNPGNTIIDATGKQNGIFDQASGLTIDGFTIENAEHEGILIEGPAATCPRPTTPPVPCTAGAPEITGVIISDNFVIDNDKALTPGASGPSCPAVGTVPPAPAFEQFDCGEGIHLDGVAFSTVTNNRIKRNAGGVLLTDETNANHNNLVSGNIAKDNSVQGVADCGFTLPSHPPNGSPANIGDLSFGVFNDTVANNLSEGNDFGTGVFTPTPGTASYGHLVVNNQLINNASPGVGFHSHAPGQKNGRTSIIGNLIEGNGPDPDVDATGDGPAAPTGIDVYADPHALPVNNVNIVGNTIRKEGNDIWVGAGPAGSGWSACASLSLTAPCYIVTAHLNDLEKGVGVNNAGNSGASPDDVLVDATKNFWGCAKGPGASGCASVTGNVTTAPFLQRPSTVH